MGVQHESLQQRRTADQFLETVQAGELEPAQDSGPPAYVRLGRFPRVRQRCPVSRRPGVMFDVIAVIEEEPIVKPAVVAHRATRMLEAAVQFAETEADEPAGKINGQQEPGRERRQAGPKQKYQRALSDPIAAQRRPAKPPVTVMRKVPGFPK